MAKHKHNWQLFKPGPRHYLRCDDETCHEVIDISLQLQQLLDEKETIYRSLSYTAQRAGYEGEEVSDETRRYVRERIDSVERRIAAETKRVVKASGK